MGQLKIEEKLQLISDAQYQTYLRLSERSIKRGKKYVDVILRERYQQSPVMEQKTCALCGKIMWRKGTDIDRWNATPTCSRGCASRFKRKMKNSTTKKNDSK